MSDTKFTPGPWHNGQTKDPAIVFDADGWAICDCKTYHRKGYLDEMRSNAHLIAAAPELYEVLSEAIERGGVIQMCLYDKAIAALAKARGEV